MACADGMIQIPRTPAYSARLAQQLQQLRADDELTDFSILSGDVSYKCHKVILAANSPVLKAMVMSGMTEASQQQVDIDNIPAAVKETLLQYMYTGEVNIPQEQLMSTVEASDYLELLELKELCLSNAVTVFEPSNIISWHKLAYKLNIDELKSKCSEILSSSLDAVSKFSEFLELTVAELNSYLSDIQETGVDQDNVLEATMGWIDHKSEQRIDHMEELMQKIEILECSVECIERAVETHKALFTKRPQIHLMFIKGLVEIAKQGGVRKRRRVTKGNRTMMVVVSGQSPGYINTTCWELTPSMQIVELCRAPVPGPWQGVCTTPGGFVLTGCGDNKSLCFMFDVGTLSWKQLTPLVHERREHASICINDKIYVFGGLEPIVSSLSTASVHSLQLNGGIWLMEPDMPMKMDFPEVASINKSIFLLDTCNGYAIYQLLHFDTVTSTWSYRACAPRGRAKYFGARMVSFQGQLLLAGGRGRSFALYNPNTDTWSTCTGSKPKLTHDFGALVSDEKKVYLIGGRNKDEVEEYDPDTAAWSVCNVKLPHKLMHLRAVTLEY